MCQRLGEEWDGEQTVCLPGAEMKDCLLFLSPINQTGAIVVLTSHWHTVAVTDRLTSHLCGSATWWAAEWGDSERHRFCKNSLPRLSMLPRAFTCAPLNALVMAFA